MNYSHYSEPSLRTGTKAPLEIPVIASRNPWKASQTEAASQFLPKLASATALVRAYVVAYNVAYNRYSG